MTFLERLKAAFNILKGPAPPQPRADRWPLWMYSINDRPERNVQINIPQLRTYSETPIVRRAIDYYRGQIARLPWDITPMEGVELPAEVKDAIQKAKRVLRRPNFDDNWMSFIGQIIEDKLVIGMGTFEIRPNPADPDQPYLLYPVDAGSIWINLRWNGSPSQPRYAQIDRFHREIPFKVGELAVLKHNVRTNSPWGLSPTAVAIQQIQYFLEAQSYAGKTASNALPKRLLWMKDLTDDQIQKLRIYFESQIQGYSTLPIIGGEDAKTLELGHIGDQALFLAWQQFLIATIANAFNLDVMKFNAVVGINRSTGDRLDDIADESAIRPMAHQLEHYINQYVLGLFEVNGKPLSDLCQFKFLFTTSYQDRKSLAVINQIELQMDMITINEARRERGLPDLPIDPVIGKSKGDMTLSEYRAMYGGQVSLDDARGIDNEFGPIEPQNPAQDAPQNADDKGQNGVHGIPKPEEKAMNQRTDSDLDMSL